MSPLTISFSIKGNLADVWKKEIYYAEVKVVNGLISSIEKLREERNGEPYILPGFIDSHVHIESSMLVPSEFKAAPAVSNIVAGTQLGAPK